MFEGQSVFHESYFEHSCTVVSEKDVLYTDIKGNKWQQIVQRWWENLFLLSYDDVRCRIYYASSQAMRLERTRQFRRHRDRIHPLSKFSNFWHSLISVVVILNRIIFHHSTAIIFAEMALVFYYVAVILEFILILDVYIHFRLGYIDKDARRIVLNTKKCIINYMSTKFFVHCASSLPLQSIMMIRYGLDVTCVICKANRFVCTLKILSVMGLYRLYDSTSYWIKEGSSFNITYFCKFFRIFILGMITMIQFHNLVYTINLLHMIQMQEIDEKSFYAMMLRIRHESKNQSIDLLYLAMELSRVVKSLFLFGYDLKPKEYYLDVMAGLFGFLLANVFFLWGLLEAYAVVNRFTYSDDQLEIHKDRTINMMRCRQLSDKISWKVVDYFHFNMSKLVVIEKVNDIYQFLPKPMIKEIKLTCYTHYVKKIPYFSEWPIKVIEDLVMMLKEDMYLAHDIVADAWTKGDGLVIVDTGTLAVYSSSLKEAGHLIDGDYFGELSLITDKEIRTSFVVATTRCKILQLDKNDFRKYMRQYPRLFFELRSQLRQEYSKPERNNDDPQDDNVPPAPAPPAEVRDAR